MKNIFVIAFGLFFINLLAVQTVKAQENKNVREMLVGEWKLDDVQNSGVDSSKISDQDRKNIESMMEEMKNSFSYHLMQNGEYEFKVNVIGQQSTDSGKWEVDKEGKNLITIGNGGKESTSGIIEIGKNKLILRQGSTIMTLIK